MQDVDVHDANALAIGSRRIRDVITRGHLDAQVREELHNAAESFLDRGPVIVRSSAVGEDSGTESFAGQLDSILHVDTPAALERAVLACWASYWSERAIFYRLVRGARQRGMGVIVQRQLDARLAGVLFTDAGDGTILVEYVAGLADRLVAGDCNPGRLRIDRRTANVERMASSGVGDADEVFTESRAAELVRLAERLERAFGGPQDVEWAIDAAGVVHVVQSRPITAALHQAMHPPAATGSRVAWSNANVNENFPEPISPFLYSIASRGYTHYFRNLARGFGISRRRIRAMEPSLARIIGVHGARMYYNLSSIHRVLRLAPFGEELARAFNTFVGATATDDVDQPSDPKASRLRSIVELVAITLRTTWQYLFLRRRIERFERTVDAFAADTEPQPLATMSLAQLRAKLAGFMDIRCHRWNDAALADAAAMVCYAALDRLLRRAYPERGALAPQMALLKAIPDVVSSRPPHELWSLSRIIRNDAALSALFQQKSADVILEVIQSDERYATFRDALQAYLDAWGFRCSGELMLTVPSLQESPGPVVEMLRTYAGLDGDSPLEAHARQAREREHETTRILAELSDRPFVGSLPAPSLATAVRVVLGWTHASIRFRERARLKQALLYSRCRRIALAIGSELVRRKFVERATDVFWLTVAEVDELASGGAMFPHHVKELVQLRSRAHAKLSATKPPASFAIPEADYLPVDRPKAESTESRDAARVLAGTPACGGRVTAPATVLESVAEVARLDRGDILVARQTDPGWAPAFFLVAGLVVERGGMLSHGAIVAREFGIPCTVGVHAATRLIPGGSTITLDGDTGHVYLG
jgi:pyruvate,water dikinase